MAKGERAMIRIHRRGRKRLADVAGWRANGFAGRSVLPTVLDAKRRIEQRLPTPELRLISWEEYDPLTGGIR